MKPFQQQAKCPKCGGGDIAASFHGTSSLRYSGQCDYSDCDGPHEEHIGRHCRCCHYHWLEAPLDAKEGE